MTTRIILLIGCVLTCTFANECEDNSKRYIPNAFWLADLDNCHKYLVCDPTTDNGDYRQYELSCGNLFWDEDINTCVENLPENARCDQNATPPPSHNTTEYPFECNFVVNPDNNREYKPKDNVNMKYTTYQSCLKNNHFDMNTCTCLPNSDVPTNTCDKRSFLSFKFDGDLDDSSCTNAKAVLAKGYVGFIDSPSGKAAVFNGSGYLDILAMRGMFAGHYVTEFSVSLFFRTDNVNSNELIFDNGNNQHDMTILLGYLAKVNSISAQIKISSPYKSHRDTKTINVLLKLDSTASKWQHVAYIYKNGRLTIILNGVKSQSKSTSQAPGKIYTIDDIDEPLSIGGRSTGDFHFNGMIDEFRVFKRALAKYEVLKIANHQFDSL